MSDPERFRDKLIIAFVDKVLFGATILVVGLIVQSVYGRAVQERTDARALLANELRQFVVPLIHRLELDSVYTCDRIAQLYEADGVPELTRWRFVYGTVLPNEEAARVLIEDRGDILATDQSLRDAAFAYARHVALYRAVAESPSRVSPSARADSKWPKELLPLLRRRETALSEHLSKCDAWLSGCATPIDWSREPVFHVAEGECLAALSVDRMAPGGVLKR